MTQDELLEYMNYPQACPSRKKRKRRDDPSDTDGGGQGKGSPPPPPDEGGDSSGPSSGGRGPGPWQASLQRFLPAAMKAANMPQQQFLLQHETDRNGRDPLMPGVRPKYGDLQGPEALMKHCEFELKLCDEKRQEKSEFSSLECICVKLTVRNTSDYTISVLIGSGQYFASGGLHVQIDDQKPGWRYNNKLSKLRLLPSNSYTFFRTFTKPEKTNCEVAYATPPSGQYTARVWLHGLHHNVSSEFPVK